MVGGFNTEIQHGEFVFHVQTEDKGAGTAWFESLILIEGRVVARKRSSYKQISDAGGGEDAISELMSRQHRLMIQEIRRGRFDALASGEETEVDTDVDLPEEIAPEGTSREEAAAGKAGTAAEGTGRSASAEPTLDQAVVDYLEEEAGQEHLVLSIDPGGEVALGNRVNILLRASSSLDGSAIVGASVSVKLISTVARPVDLATAETDDLGLAELSIQLPRVERGSAAILITGSSSIGGAEIKHLL